MTLTSRCSPADAGQLVAEPGKQSLGAEFDLAALAAAAGDLVVANAPDDIGNDNVASLGRTLGRFRFALRLGQALERLLDIVVGDLRHHLFEAKRSEIGRRHVRQDFQRQRVFEVGAFGARHEFKARRQRRPQIALANRLGRTVLTALSKTSPRTAAPYRLRNSGSGTLPGRKPGIRTIRPTSSSRLVTLSSTSFAGIVILNSRFSPSALVSVTFMAACSHSLRRFGLASVWTAPVGLAPVSPCLGTSAVQPALPAPLRAGQDSGHWCGRGDLNPHVFIAGT